MPPFDVEAVRRRFPALAVEHGGRPLAFFDGPGGTQVPDVVIDAVTRYYTHSNANHGGAFATSIESDAIVAEARRAFVDLLGAHSPDEIKFGANMTSLTFHISRSLGALSVDRDEIVVTRLDHEANIGPWLSIAGERGLSVRTVDIRAEDGTLDFDSFDAAIGPRTRLVAFGYASNAPGTINPVAELVARAHAVGALTYVDAVHFAPHGPIDVAALETDMLVCSAYKFFGPHVGVLYLRTELGERLPTYKIRPAEDRVETGTGDFEGIAGAAAAVDYLAWLGREMGDPWATGAAGRRTELVAVMEAIRTYESGLFARLAAGLTRIPGLRLWGITDPARFADRTPTAAVTLEGIHPRAAAVALAARGFATWDGDFYATGLIERLGLADSGGILRIGIAHYTTADEVDRLLDALDALARGG